MNSAIATTVMELAYKNMSPGFHNQIEFSRIKKAISEKRTDRIINLLVGLMHDQDPIDHKNITLFQEYLWFVKVLRELADGGTAMLEQFILHQYNPSLPQAPITQSVQLITNDFFNNTRPR
jgi:hypothetical protein